MNEFPSEFNPEGSDEMPPHLAAIVGHMFSRDERPDTRELEWANVLEPLVKPLGGESNMSFIRIEIERALNKGFGLSQKFIIKRGIFYWQGARLRKPEGE